MRVQPHGLAVDGDDVAKIQVVGQITVVEMIGQYASLFPTRRREGWRPPEDHPGTCSPASSSPQGGRPEKKPGLK